MCLSRLNPCLSSKALLNGEFDYNRTPLAPPGTKIIVHEVSSVRKTWAPHGVNGWYIRWRPWTLPMPLTFHPKNWAMRISPTVKFFPYFFDMTSIFSVDAAVDVTTVLTNALRHPYPATPFASVSNTQHVDLVALAEFLSTPPKTLHQPRKQHQGW